MSLLRISKKYRVLKRSYLHRFFVTINFGDMLVLRTRKMEESGVMGKITYY